MLGGKSHVRPPPKVRFSIQQWGSALKHTQSGHSHIVEMGRWCGDPAAFCSPARTPRTMSVFAYASRLSVEFLCFYALRRTVRLRLAPLVVNYSTDFVSLCDYDTAFKALAVLFCYASAHHSILIIMPSGFLFQRGRNPGDVQLQQSIL